jgi:hypothetical protein
MSGTPNDGVNRVQVYYDGRNEMVRADYAVDITAGGSFNGIAETRSHDAVGHVLMINQFYALGTTLDTRPNTKGDPNDIAITGA